MRPSGRTLKIDDRWKRKGGMSGKWDSVGTLSNSIRRAEPGKFRGNRGMARKFLAMSGHFRYHVFMESGKPR